MTFITSIKKDPNPQSAEAPFSRSNCAASLSGTNEQKASSWSIIEVIDRWRQLYKLPQAVARYQRSETLLEVERMMVNQYVGTWRERLFDISWLTRCLNCHLGSG